MTGKERISRILARQPVDRVGLGEHFWYDTLRKWDSEGHLGEGESLESHFCLDISDCWTFNTVLDLDFETKVVSEDEDTITMLDGNGATLRRHKKHDTTPEHVDFSISDYESWKKVRHLLTVDERRINFEAYRNAKKEAEEAGRFFALACTNVFEMMHPLCGHVNMLMGMVLEPEWIAEMAHSYSRLVVELQKILFEREGLPDGIWYYEDMGYKQAPFMSPHMYRELIQPYHTYTIDFAHSLGLPVIMHSCGYVAPLLPGMIEAGIDCLQALEVKAGMDLLELHKLYGDKIVFMGGLDVRTLSTNDRDVIDAELNAKIPLVKEGFGYIVHSDHSIPESVDYDTYRYFIKKSLELGSY